MRKVTEIYPDLYHSYGEDHRFRAPYCYVPMLQEFGEIVLQVDEDNWQGDSWVLYKDGDKYGYLCFGWGSCSGCDSLQGCESEEELENLMHSLCSAIQWYDSKEACWEYFHGKDWTTDYAWRNDEFKRFINEAIELLQ